MNIRRIVLVILISISSSMNVFSQNQNMENEIVRIRALGKDSIITIANSILANKYPTLKIDSRDFEISAWANKSVVAVRYTRFIKFFSLENKSRNFIYDISVDIIEKKIDPLDTWGIGKFYIPTEDDIKKIEFVKKNLSLPVLGFENEIQEKTNKYELHLTNDTTFSIYTIDKITGVEILPPIDGHNDPAPIDENIDPMIKINK